MVQCRMFSNRVTGLTQFTAYCVGPASLRNSQFPALKGA